jgi:cytosine/adenosine deaminase-related metal-dependent hydrolase
MNRRFTADYIFPVNVKPIKEGVVELDAEGNIMEISAKRRGDETYWQGIICPGFVNVHCHTEWSFVRGLISENTGIDHFISELERLKKLFSMNEIQDSIAVSLDEMYNNGIVAVGDLMNTDWSKVAKANSSIEFYNFIEVYGLRSDQCDTIWDKALALYHSVESPKNIIPHSPYSLSKELFEKVHVFQKKNQTLSLHLLESQGEVDYFMEAKGPLFERFKRWGLPIPSTISTAKRPLQSVVDFIQNSNRILLIHNTFINEEDLLFANEHLMEVYYGLCPNANLFIENQLPPLDLLRQKEAIICLGTDSLASNHQLSILSEMKTLQANFNIGLEELIQFACLNGAKALGISNQFGSLEIAKKPGLVLIENVFEQDNFNLRNATAKRIA